MERDEDLSDALLLAAFGDNPRCSVLDTLELLHKAVGDAIQQRVALVKTTRSKGLHHLLCDLFDEIAGHFSDVAKMVKTCLTNLVDVLLHAESVVLYTSDVTHS